MNSWHHLFSRDPNFRTSNLWYNVELTNFKSTILWSQMTWKSPKILWNLSVGTTSRWNCEAFERCKCSNTETLIYITIDWFVIVCYYLLVHNRLVYQGQRISATKCNRYEGGVVVRYTHWAQKSSTRPLRMTRGLRGSSYLTCVILMYVQCMYGMVWYGMVWYGMVWYGMVWYGMVYIPMFCNNKTKREESKLSAGQQHQLSGFLV